MRLPLLLGACGALLGSFGIAGLANGMWATPSAWEHSRAGFQVALGLPYGFQDSPIVFSRPSGLTLTSAQVDTSSPSQKVRPASNIEKSRGMKVAKPHQQRWMLAHMGPPDFSHSFLTARVEPPASPEAPAPTSPPALVHSINSVQDNMDATLVQAMARADRQALRAARASLKAAHEANSTAMLVSTIELEMGAATGQDLRQLKREVNEAKAMLRVAQTFASRVQAGDFSGISVNYDSQTRCGSANLVPGCLPLKPSDMARIRSESAEQLSQAQLDFREAQENLARARKIDPSRLSSQDRLTDG